MSFAVDSRTKTSRALALPAVSLIVCLAAFPVMAQAQRKVAAKPAVVLDRLKQQARAAAGQNASDALKLLLAAVTRDPQWGEGWWLIGSSHYDADRYVPARDAFARYVELEPKNGAGWAMLGLCDFELRDFGLSLQHVQRGRALGIASNPELGEVTLYHQALDLISIGEFEQAALLLDGFARADKRSDGVLLALGAAALRVPILPAQLSESADPGYVDLIRRTGEAEYLSGQKKFPDAEQIYLDLLGRHPNVHYLHYAYAVLLLRLGQSDKADAQFRTELEQTPLSVPARLQLATLAMSAGANDKAVPLAEQAVKLEPKFFPAHYVLGNALLRQGHLDSAVRELEISRDLEPTSSEVRYSLAQAYLRMHRKQDAAREQQAFQQLKPIEDSLVHRGTLPASLFTPPAEQDTRRN